MDRYIIVSCALISAMALGGCASMSDTERRVTTGAAIGGAAAGVVSGRWGWAAAGAAAGAASGYLYDQSKKSEERAYEQGLRDGKKK